MARAARKIAARSTLAGLVLSFGVVPPIRSQARPPLPVASDSSGVLSAIRAVDLRQLCRCPIVLLDSVVRRASRRTMFEIVHQPAWFALAESDRVGLRLAGHRPVLTALRSITAARRDTALMAVQAIPTTPPNARFLVVVTPPPPGVTTAYLVGLTQRRTLWAVSGVRTVFDP